MRIIILSIAVLLSNIASSQIPSDHFMKGDSGFVVHKEDRKITGSGSIQPFFLMRTGIGWDQQLSFGFTG